MFIDTKTHLDYQVENEYGSHPLSACASVSFSSDFSSDDSVDEYILTPVSTPERRHSLGDIKTENLSEQFPTPSRTPNHFTVPTNFCQMSSMGQDIMAGFQDSFIHHDQSFDSAVDMSAFNANFPIMVTPAHQSFSENHGLPNCTPALDFSSPSVMDTSFSENFVIPSQTQTQNVFMDTQSPSRPNSMNFVLQYDSPAASDYSSCMSSTQSPMRDASTYNMYQNSSSSPCTSTRPSGLRHQRFAALPSSAALHRVQDQSPTRACNTQQALESYHQQLENMQRRARKIHKRATAVSPSSEAPAITYTHVEASKKACSWHGCDKKFKRQEHLKRHFRTHTEGREDGVECVFCEKPKWFTRGDNYKAHLKLHMNLEGSSKRTPYHEGAETAYYALKSKPRTKKVDFPAAPLGGRSRL